MILYRNYVVKHKDKRRKAREMTEEHIKKYVQNNSEYRACITTSIGLEDKNKKFRFFAKVFHNNNHLGCDCFEVQLVPKTTHENIHLNELPMEQTVKKCLGHAQLLFSFPKKNANAREALRQLSQNTLAQYSSDPNYKNNSALQTHAFSRRAAPLEQNDLFIFFQHSDNHKDCDRYCLAPSVVNSPKLIPDITETTLSEEAIIDKLMQGLSVSAGFSKGLSIGIMKGSWNGAINLLKDTRNLPKVALQIGSGLLHPLKTGFYIAQKIDEVASFVKENLDKESLILLYESISQMIKNCPPEKKGEYLGIAIGQLTVEILSFNFLILKGGKWLKKISASRKIIPKLNRQKAKALTEAAIKIAKERQAFKAKCKLHKAHQMKHYVENGAIEIKKSIVYWDLEKNSC